MLVWIILLLIVAVAALACGYLFGFLRIEKVELEDKEPDFELPAEQMEEADQEKPLIDLDDGISLKEKMNLDGRETGSQAAEPEQPRAYTENGPEQFDRLTSFRGGRSYRRECQQRLDEAQQERSTVAAAWFDFDRFRFINSLKGVSIGDYVLTRMGQELQNVFPEDSIISRISADHFVAVFPVSSIDVFEYCASRLQEICEQLRGDIGVKSGLRACMGIALTDGEKDYDIDVLLHKANIARACIKASRTESWKIFEESMVSTNLYGESALEDYEENQYDEEFVIYYAPQQDLNMRHTVGCSVKVRWVCEDSETQGSLNAALDNGKIPTNATKVIYQACRAMSRWRKAGKQIQTACISVPITELYKVDFDEFLKRVLSEFQLEPMHLAIMVDATMIPVDWAIMSRQLKRLHEMGVKVGVDEIDARYQNLDIITDLPVDFVKLHKTLVEGIDTEDGDKDSIGRLLLAAREAKVRVIVEGVDTQDQADVLHAMGVVTVEGRYCGKTERAEEYGNGLPENMGREDFLSNSTVILDEAALSRGDFNLF